MTTLLLVKKPSGKNNKGNMPYANKLYFVSDTISVGKKCKFGVVQKRNRKNGTGPIYVLKERNGSIKDLHGPYNTVLIHMYYNREVFIVGVKDNDTKITFGEYEYIIQDFKVVNATLNTTDHFVTLQNGNGENLEFNLETQSINCKFIKCEEYARKRILGLFNEFVRKNSIDIVVTGNQLMIGCTAKKLKSYIIFKGRCYYYLNGITITNADYDEDGVVTISLDGGTSLLFDTRTYRLSIEE